MTSSSSISSTSSTSESIFNNTVLCKFFERGKCARGRECSFAHGASALRRKPDLTRTKFCSAIQNGPCPFGEECIFAHTKAELQKCRPRHVQRPGRVARVEVPALGEMACGEEVVPLDGTSPDQVLKPGRQLPYLRQAQMPDEQRAATGESTSLEPPILYPSVKNTFLHFEAESSEPILHRIRTWPTDRGTTWSPI